MRGTRQISIQIFFSFGEGQDEAQKKGNLSCALRLLLFHKRINPVGTCLVFRIKNMQLQCFFGCNET